MPWPGSAAAEITDNHARGIDVIGSAGRRTRKEEIHELPVGKDETMEVHYVRIVGFWNKIVSYNHTSVTDGLRAYRCTVAERQHNRLTIPDLQCDRKNARS